MENKKGNENLEKNYIHHPYPYYPCYEEDEIDLYELFLILKKRFKIIIFTTLFAFVISLGYIFISKPVYQNSFILKIPVVYISENGRIKELLANPLEVKLITENLNNLIKHKEYEKLTKILNVKDIDTIKNIEKIDVEIPRGAGAILKITINSYKTEIFDKIREKLLMFLNDKYKNRLNIYKTLPQNILKNHLKDIKGLSIEFKEPISNIPVKPKKKLILAVGLITGLFLGIFIAFFVEWLENARKRYEEKLKKESS